ncbi:GYDIA family GHMP kinase [Flavicella sediminum]|uniref:GYDIA family GHMP kinase n=1 Tax=Flavicella sediminum TaxID=2585141 RepID=UPI00111F352E|nr:GYDIA family GHMP kinase [Flavicella sediminum]
MEKFYSNGKLLISGEYCVLDGALSFALPTKFGQSLEVSSLDVPVIIWESFSVLKELWFQTEFKLSDLEVESNNPMLATLKKILHSAQKLNPEFLNDGNGAFVQTFLSFPNNWGLGTSSTLINNIANWAKVDAFMLLQNSFGGSGYDIACAQNNTPIYYTRKEGVAKVETVSFEKDFLEKLFFVYLNEKQDSKEGIKAYKSLSANKEECIQQISELSEKIVASNSLKEFEGLLNQHEELIGNLLQVTPVKQRLFSDYFGSVKSLGAWGGDFVLVTGDETTPEYFFKKGFETVIPYEEMIL